MFDIGFWEILIVCLIVLIVVGPEKLPEFVYQASEYLNTIRRLINNLKREFQNEVLDKKRPFQQQLDDLDDLIKNAPDQESTASKTKQPDDRP